VNKQIVNVKAAKKVQYDEWKAYQEWLTEQARIRAAEEQARRELVAQILTGNNKTISEKQAYASELRAMYGVNLMYTDDYVISNYGQNTSGFIVRNHSIPEKYAVAMIEMVSLSANAYGFWETIMKPSDSGVAQINRLMASGERLGKDLINVFYPKNQLIAGKIDPIKATEYFVGNEYVARQAALQALQKAGTYTPGQYINNQNDWSSILYGTWTTNENGCEWIATYNALIGLGYTSADPLQIMDWYEQNGALMLNGQFGTNPAAIKGYFESNYPELTVTVQVEGDSSNLRNIVNNYDSAIITHFNNPPSSFIKATTDDFWEKFIPALRAKHMLDDIENYPPTLHTVAIVPISQSHDVYNGDSVNFSSQALTLYIKDNIPQKERSIVYIVGLEK